MTQRTWFITGVNSGFGRLMTEQLLARGDRVAGTVRKMDTMDAMIKDTSRLPPGDPAKMSAIIVDSLDQEPAPKRIVLGTDAWRIIQKALADRLAAVEAQKDLAASTDIPASI
jgi:NADP-dependent 3-hydroxy acid dehydrogenase YdfG